jgi:uncharacterized protein (TIGR02996 family)
MKPTPECFALLRSIAAAPDDDTPRLVFADWLDENSSEDADLARAEFIRLSCKMKTKLRMSPAEGKWLDANAYRLLPSVIKKFQKHKLKDFGISRSGRNVRIHTNLNPKDDYGEGHIFLHLEFWRGFARKIEYGTINPGCFAAIGKELAADEPLAWHQPEFFHLPVYHGNTMRGVWVNPQMCCGREVWERVEGYTSLEGEADKFFAFTGKKKRPEWEAFGNEFVLGQIRKPMTAMAREGSGWPADWNAEDV